MARQVVLLTTILLGMSASSWAGSVTIGNYDSGNCYPYSCGPSLGLTEFQQQYLASSFGVPGPIQIDDFSITSWTGNYSSDTDTDTALVYLSTATNALGSDSANLASNEGADNTLFATVTFGPEMPATFTVTGTSPFTYNPANGDLLIDVQFTGPSNALGYTNSYFNADYTGATTTRNYTDEFGTTANDVGGLVTTFDYTSGAPEPATLALMGSALAGLIAWRKRRAA